MKKKNDELVGKLSAVEQLNAKYKAKLKQLLGKQKVETSENKTNKTSTTQNETEETRPCTPLPAQTNNHVQTSSVEVQTELDQFELNRLYHDLNELKTESIENNTLKHTPISCNIEDESSREFIRKTLRDLKHLNKEITECLINDQIKINILRENYSKLEIENGSLLREKTQIETELKEALKCDEVRTSEKLKLELQFAEVNAQLNELILKFNSLEQQNLKYKAKLKQLLKPKPTATNSGEKLNVSTTGLLSLTNEELRSNCSTPIDHSPMNRIDSVSASVQTDENEQAAFGRNETMLNEVLFEISSNFTYIW